MSLSFPFEINIVSCRHKDCLTPQFIDIEREEEAPAEQHWVLLNALEELWHQTHGHLWLKQKQNEQKHILYSRGVRMRAGSSRQGCPSSFGTHCTCGTNAANLAEEVNCCGPLLPVILFKILQLSRICLCVCVCSTLSCANYVPVDSEQSLDFVVRPLFVSFAIF